jgi:error-prone DNA polymerase
LQIGCSHPGAIPDTVSRYRARGAVRKVGKALGVPEDITGSLARLIWGWSEDGVTDAELKELNLNPSDRRLRLTLDLAHQRETCRGSAQRLGALRARVGGP